MIALGSTKRTPEEGTSNSQPQIRIRAWPAAGRWAASASSLAQLSVALRALLS